MAEMIKGATISRAGKLKRLSAPTTSTKKSVSYVASGTNSSLIVALSGTDSSSVITADTTREVRITNTSRFSIVVLVGYQQYTDEDTQNAQLYLHTLLKPNETMSPPVRGVISTQGANDTQTHGDFANRSLWNLDGTVLDWTAPNTALKVDAGDNVASGEANNTTDPVVFELDNGHEKYRVGDYLRLDTEIVKVIGTYDDNPSGETVADNHIAVSRGHFGSTTASHSSTPDVYFPIANEHYDFDRPLSGSSQLVQTDALGRFKVSNFFGYGRANSASAPFGIVPGTVGFKFYNSAYQEVMLGGTGADGGAAGSNIPITSATNSKLAVSSAYAFNITIDDSSATTVSFTTDSSNTKFGGTDGIISKMQTALNTASRTAGNGLFGYTCTIGIIEGKLRFTSDSHLLPHDGTNGSKILLEDAGSGTNLFAGSSGIFPDIVLVNAPVPPSLPDLNVYDLVTYNKMINMAGVCYDDSNGNLVGAATGTVNYETGAVDMQNAPKNASFEITVTYNSPFSGKLDANKSDSNTISGIYANTLSKNHTGEVLVETFK